MPIFFFKKGAGDPLVTRPLPGRRWRRRSRRARCAVQHLEADQCALNAALLLLDQHVAAEEFALVGFADPAEAGFPERGGLVNFVAVEAHAGFEAQRVARAEAAGKQSFSRAAVEKIVPRFARNVRGAK